MAGRYAELKSVCQVRIHKYQKIKKLFFLICSMDKLEVELGKLQFWLGLEINCKTTNLSTSGPRTAAGPQVTAIIMLRT
jgi:hypothetical protein